MDMPKMRVYGKVVQPCWCDKTKKEPRMEMLQLSLYNPFYLIHTMKKVEFKAVIGGLLWPYVPEPYSEFKLVEDTAVIDEKLMHYLTNYSNERGFWQEIAMKSKEELGSYFIPIEVFESVFKEYKYIYTLLKDLDQEFGPF